MFRLLQRPIRRALLTLAFLLAWVGAGFACAPDMNVMFGRADSYSETLGSGSKTRWQVFFAQETSEYGHNIMGRLQDARAIVLRKRGDDTQCHKLVLPKNEVFEDIAPRFVDITGDGRPEILTVISNFEMGARMVILDRDLNILAQTRPIGRRNRWLAIVGAADFDGDGQIEIAYVDRPHLKKALRIWRLKGKRLVEVAKVPDLTNHKIGWDFIEGGVRRCGERPEMVLGDATWSEVKTVRFKDGRYVAEASGLAATRSNFNAFLTCRD